MTLGQVESEATLAIQSRDRLLRDVPKIVIVVVLGLMVVAALGGSIVKGSNKYPS